jgi:hypothetical protein
VLSAAMRSHVITIGLIFFACVVTWTNLNT